MRQIDKDTRLCMSLAAKPGNFGNRFHNFLYEKLGLNFIYKSGTTKDLAQAIGGIRALDIRGCALSMPFKEQALAFLDEVEPIARTIGAVNTIVNNKGHLLGINTDWSAVRDLLLERKIPRTSNTAVAGSGGMAKAVVRALYDTGFTSVTIVSRNANTGGSLAESLGFSWAAEIEEAATFEFLINATPLGMVGDISTSMALPFSEGVVERARYICDVVANPSQTPLVALAQKLNKNVITGFDVTGLQAREQFRLYTGVNIPQELFQQALIYSSL